MQGLISDTSFIIKFRFGKLLNVGACAEYLLELTPDHNDVHLGVIFKLVQGRAYFGNHSWAQAVEVLGAVH